MINHCCMGVDNKNEITSLRALVRKMGNFCKWVEREGNHEAFSFDERQQKGRELQEILGHLTAIERSTPRAPNKWEDDWL